MNWPTWRENMEAALTLEGLAAQSRIPDSERRAFGPGALGRDSFGAVNIWGGLLQGAGRQAGRRGRMGVRPAAGRRPVRA